MKNEKSLYGRLDNGQEVYAYDIKAENGNTLRVMTLGAGIDRIIINDKNNSPVDVTCGYDTPQKYIDAHGYQGLIAGRYANRIGGARFTLNGKEYTLPKNDGENSLHGGNLGFSYVVWNEKECGDHYVVFNRRFADGEDGYPGNIDVSVKYAFNGEVVTIVYDAVSDADTVFNPTNHTYFNLAGAESGDVKSHIVWVNSDFVTEVSDDLIPTGSFTFVEETKFDLRKPVPLEAAIDDNFVLRKFDMRHIAAEAWCDITGIKMQVRTDMPGMQLYTGNMMNGTVNFRGDIPQTPHHAFCMETQFYPDSPNHVEFPSTVLKAGTPFHSETSYLFSIKKPD